jgi:ankyrin repeat protein
MNLHEACYAGRLELVRQLLEAGADPNEPSEDARWISAAARPRPLNCVAIAWAMTSDHVRIARLLIEHGAVVDASTLTDLDVEAVGGANDAELSALFREHARR